VVFIDRTIAISSATLARFRNLRARSAVARERERRRQQLRRAFDEGEALALDQLGGDVFAVVLREGGLRIEEIDLRRRPGHEEVDHALRPGREPPRRVGPRLRARAGLRLQRRGVGERREREAADAERGLLEEVAAGDPLEAVFVGGHSATTPS
jgi:hypothetical protein